MIAPPLRGGASRKLAQNCDQGCVKDRNKENQNGNRKNGQEASRSSAADINQRGTRQKKPDKQRATVAHKDGCRIRVVDQETEERSSKNEQHEGLGELPGRSKAQ